jgi:hypothetical protein
LLQASLRFNAIPPTLLTDIVKEPMPALDEMSGLEPAHVGIRNPSREI